jgi:hypothetical protein
MIDIMPLEEPDLEVLSVMARGGRVLLDGYRDASVPIALAGPARCVVIANPHLHHGCAAGSGLFPYVSGHLHTAGLLPKVLPMEYVGIDLYDIWFHADFDLVVIDPDPDRGDLDGRLDRALHIFPAVVLVDRTGEWSEAALRRVFEIGEQFAISAPHTRIRLIQRRRPALARLGA